MGVVLLVSEGWTLHVTAWGLAVCTAAVGFWTGAHQGLLERRAGRLRRGWLWWITGAAALAGALALGSHLQGRPPLAAPPTVLLPVAGVLLLLIGFGLPQRPPGARQRPQRPQRPGDAPPQQWFDDLAALLRGRYLLTRREVARHVDEARSCWVDSGAAHPAEEFGTVAEHAARSMDGSPEPERGLARGKAWIYSAATVLWCWTVGEEAATEGPGWGLAWRLAGLLLFALSALHEWGRLHRRRAERPQDHR
ncbi:hypothetical protein [Kineococcus auxinigenes]|uniref:hypothetical protein n=1 Tax=unclassified Kineococcus TaxID=2621656 RepID=UPI003D7D810F